MAHEIMEHDNMFSVREKPWHGLGVILENAPTIDVAIQESGLDWQVEVWPSFVQSPDGSLIEVPERNAVVRTDINKVIGSVGNRYTVYQNDEMWSFIEAFQDKTDCKLETAGSLRNGRNTWVLAKNQELEYLAGDPVEEYFVFRNSFDGSSPIMVMFTNIRVVCNNTMQMAIRGANNIFKVRHTINAQNNLDEVQKALGYREKYQVRMLESMKVMLAKNMTATDTTDFLENVIFPKARQVKQVVGADGKVNTVMEITKRAETMRSNRIEAVSNLVETGAGADIAGVRGTAYGMFQALVEYADHEKQIKVGERDRLEAKFENTFWGSGATFKTDCFKQVMAMAV